MHPSDLDTAPDIRSRLSAARLPAMPQILLQLIEHCDADEMRMADVAKLVAKDVALTAKIFELAVNGSSYHRSNRPASIEQALNALGSDMVRTLLIRESIAQVFDGATAPTEVDLRGYWRHSLTAAVAAQMLAVKIGYPHIEEAYLAGLLHDVGRLALLMTVPDEYSSNVPAGDDENLCSIERRMLHITHPQAGACLLARWELDSFLADSVLYHHEPVTRLEKAHPLIRIGFLAHQISEEEHDEHALEALGSACGVDPGVLSRIRGRAAARVEKLAATLGIDLIGTEKMQGPVMRPAVMRDRARERLAARVRDLVLASEAGRSFARQDAESKLLETITQSALLLFDFEDVILFLIDDKAQALIGAPVGPHRRRLAGFSIPLNTGGALAATAHQSRLTTISHQGDSLGVAEEQLLRILGTQHLVCVPLVVASRCHGVVIGAAASSQLPSLHQREDFLRAFGTQVASALKAASSQRNETSRVVATLKEKYREAARRAAHEANNPLSIIKNYLSVLDRKLAKQEPVGSEISILNEEINRVGQIINSLGDLQPAAREGSTEVNRVIDEVVRLFRDTEYIPPAVKITARVQDQPIVVDGDADVLKQILVNLMKNAVEALAGAGEIAIGTNGFVNRDGQLYVELWLKDTGPGIDPQLMAHLFAPTRSSKAGEHRGIGLSIVHGQVKQLQGFITCRSDSNGTTFEILLPSGAGMTPAAQWHSRNPVQR
jgi:HD-like signal output (HDOD) protein/signal transduction histidine kinase